MSEIHAPPVQVGPPPFAADSPLAIPQIDRIGVLLRVLDTPTVGAGPSGYVFSPEVDDRLARAKLGGSSSLFTVLRCRYAASAAHALRVALSCSAWGVRQGMEPAHQSRVEVAALWHDIGVVGVPDRVLFKPGPLEPEESVFFDHSRRLSVEILQAACAEAELLAIVENVGAWFDGSRPGFGLCGQQLPTAARMIAVAEAFDSMTTEQVYRRALPQERALGELFQGAGRQFDPRLVEEFAALVAENLPRLHCEAAERWLGSADSGQGLGLWERTAPSPRPPAPHNPLELFSARLLDHMHDAVVFLDGNLRIVRWNHGAERLTGISAAGISHRLWSPALLKMQNEKGEPVADEDCPVLSAVRTGVQSLRRLVICGRGGRPVAVDSHAIPVLADDGRACGAVLLLHDASSETSLEARCQSLYERATRDPLTQVANRAEFDRVFELFVSAHQEQRVPCSLMICDLDHFKQVNDQFGHPAGDEAIKALASVLRSACRSGDLVARYGGEEFVMLCAHTDIAAATRRAEEIRRTLACQRLPVLGGKSVTASFGVTEIQPGDTPATMLRRADRALLLAKQQGRNRVVQLGMGCDPEGLPPRPVQASTGPSQPVVLHQQLVTPVPASVAVEKLRGFVADHQARVIRTDGNHLELHIDDYRYRRRASDRPVAFRVQIRLQEEQVARPGPSGGPGCEVIQTRMFVTIAPLSHRDRRRSQAAERARELSASLRSYLMATQEAETAEAVPPDNGILYRVRKIFLPWLLKPEKDSGN